MVMINNRDKIEWFDGMTVTGLLEQMKYTYDLITVTVNNNLVFEEDYDDFPIPDQAQVGVFHLAHGG
jgi:thiamine biosynthesis protein ThiS